MGFRLWRVFKNKVLETGEPFDMIDIGSEEEVYYHFMQNKMGVARYVYGCSSLNEDYCTSIDANYKLVAIVSDFDHIIYVVNTYFFARDRNPNLPEGMMSFNGYVDEVNEKIVDLIFSKLWKEIPRGYPRRLIKAKTEKCRIEARRAILCGISAKEEAELLKPRTIVSHDKVSKLLCGYTTIEEMATENLAKNREAWMAKKFEINKIQELIRTKDVVMPIEVKMAEGIRSLDRRTQFVKVEFDVLGREANARMDPQVIFNRLINDQPLDACDFVSRDQAKEVMKNLKVGFNYDENCMFERELQIMDIRRITHLSNVVYNRNKIVNHK